LLKEAKREMGSTTGAPRDVRSWLSSALLMTAGSALYMVLIRVFHDTPVVFAGAVSALQLFFVGWLVVDPLTVSSTDAWMLVLFGVTFAVAVVL